jgi:hypothetical protein
MYPPINFPLNCRDDSGIGIMKREQNEGGEEKKTPNATDGHTE